MNQGTSLGSQLGRWIILAAVVVALGALLLTIRPAGAQETETRQVEYEENSDQQVDRFNARDPEGGNVYWSLSGDDASHFSLSTTKGGSTGLNFKSPPNYEDPSGGGDTGTANVYKVTVQAGDGGADPFLEYAVTVTVTDENEPGKIGLTQVQPQVGSDVRAMAADGTVIDAMAANIAKIDPDTASAVSWQWASSSSMDGTYMDIEDDATSHTYTPVEGDIGMFLMVTATYLDNTSDSNTDERQVSAKSEYAVRARPMGNNAPAFPDLPAGTTAITASIPENTGPGHPIDMPVVATDSDDDPLIYSLADDSGTSGDYLKFNIDPKTGQILTKTKLNYDVTGDTNCSAQNACVVVVTATDPSGQEDTRDVNIAINNVNEAPTITLDTVATAFTVGEFTGGAAAYTLTATATDYTYVAAHPEGETTTTWTVEGADSSRFSISDGGILSFSNCSPDAGTPVTRGCPNFEDPKDNDGDNVYEIEVVAADSDSNKSSQRVTVKVTNVEEAGTVTLSTRQGQVGVQVTAKLTDGDGGLRDVKWQWYQGTDATTKAEGRGNTSPTYTPVAADATAGLFVQVTYTDAATSVTAADPVDPTDVPGETETASTSLAATSVRETPDRANTAPEFQHDHDNDTGTTEIKVPDGKPYAEPQEVAENQDPRTVGDVTVADDGTVTVTDVAVDAIDADSGATVADDTLTYSLSGTDAAYFTIAADTGQISTKARFDYEKKNSYTVMVKVADGFGASDSVRVNIKVINLDEPVTTTGDKIVDYTENGMGAAATYAATDPEGLPVALSLADAADAATADGGLFEINPRSGVLSFKKSPDYEKPQDRDEANPTTPADCAASPAASECNNVYKVTVNATVSGGTAVPYPVVIRVTNEPEAPAFPSSTVNVLTIDENTVDEMDETRVVGNPVVATDSDGDNDPLTYTLGGPDAESFTINSATAQIMTAVFLDYEVRNTYSVVVTATDWSDRSADLTVTIEVADVDEAVEDINLSVTGSAAVSYDENGTAAVGEYMAEASGADPAAVDWTLGGNDAGAFMLEGTGASRMLKFSSAPDFEAPADTGADNVYNVTLVITHPTEDTISGNLPVAVTVANVDEDASVTITPDTQPQAGSMLTAELMDGDDETGVSWQWSKSMTMDGQFMDIDGAKMATYTPGETDGGYYLRATVMYTDSTFGMKTEMATTTATVNRAPMLSAESYSAMVAENSAGGTTVAEDIMATDADGDTLAYSLRGNGNANFAIGSDGAVTVAQGASLDHETAASYSLTVMVDDGSGGSDTAMLEITVTNVNEGPEFSADSYTGSIAENADAGTAVGVSPAISVTDVDGDTLAYTLSGEGSDNFAIDSDGMVTVAEGASLDYETTMSYSLTVTVSDGTLSDTAMLDIMVTDVADEGPVLSADSYTGSIAEDAAGGANVEVSPAISATSADSEATLTFSLSGDGSDNFAIDGGAVTTAQGASLDYEITMSYSLTVTVSDGTLSDTAMLDIMVTNVDEPGMLTLSPIEPVVGTEMTATLTDPDGVVEVEWQWSRSMTLEGTYTHIDEETSSYTPKDDDEGYYLKVAATYTDGEGSGKELEAQADGTVPHRLMTKYDTDRNGSIDRSEVIAAINRYLGREAGVTRADVVWVINRYLES